MTADPRALGELLTESQDLQADAVRSTGDRLDELVERSHEAGPDDPEANRRFDAEHRRRLQQSLGGAPVLGAVGGGLLLGLLASPAFATSAPDVQLLQTATSIENLAVNTYATAETLAYVGGSTANPVVKKFVEVTKSQHTQHAKAFAAAVRSLGGKPQTHPDPAFVPVVNKAVASLAGASAAQGAMGVVSLALELEDVAAQTYVEDTITATSSANKALFASIMGVEAQHAAVLRAVQALLKATAPQLISLTPATATKLPSAAGDVGFPTAFFPTATAAPASQGAVK